MYEPVTNDDYAAFSATFANGVGRHRGLPGRRRARQRPDLRGVLRERRRHVRPAPAGRDPAVPARGQRPAGRLPAGHPRPGASVPGRRPGDGRRPASASARTTPSSTRPAPSSKRSPASTRPTSLPRCATFDEGVHNMELLAAVAESAANGGSPVSVNPPRSRCPLMKLGVYNAILHDRPLPEALEGHRRPRADRHRDQLRRVPARRPHPDLRRHPGQRHRPRRLPRHLRGHRRVRSPG